MITKDFEYHRPGNLDEACRLLAELPDAQVLAGGTDLLVDIESGIRRASHVVSLQGLAGLRRLEEVDGKISIGSACTARAVELSPLIQAHFPEIIEVVKVFASPQVRTRATVGGNICGAVACGDFPVILVALGAEVELVSREETRFISMGDFFIANRKTVRKEDEILTRILVPKKGPSSSACYIKFQRRASNSLAVAGVGCFLQMEEGSCRTARIVLGAVAPKPLLAAKASRSLEGKEINDEAITRAAELAREAARPISDVRGTKEFRRELVLVLTRRAIRQVLERIKDNR
ncbi:MAG: FAD binding domain-containing protein [Fidelibacterota bacterium]